jgi:hypothetical protein
METSNIVHDIVSDSVYNIRYNDANIVYDIGIHYRIPITMEDYVMMLSYVYSVALIHLNSPLKGYPRWNWSLQRIGKVLQSQVEVFLIDVHPIWNTTQELMDWSRIGSRELSSRNILVHIDRQSPFHVLHCCLWTAYVEHFVLFRNSSSDVCISIVYDIVYYI